MTQWLRWPSYHQFCIIPYLPFTLMHPAVSKEKAEFFQQTGGFDVQLYKAPAMPSRASFHLLSLRGLFFESVLVWTLLAVLRQVGRWTTRGLQRTGATSWCFPHLDAEFLTAAAAWDGLKNYPNIVGAKFGHLPAWGPGTAAWDCEGMFFFGCPQHGGVEQWRFKAPLISISS